jgi:hypothetical protein
MQFGIPLKSQIGVERARGRCKVGSCAWGLAARGLRRVPMPAAGRGPRAQTAAAARLGLPLTPCKRAVHLASHPPGHALAQVRGPAAPPFGAGAGGCAYVLCTRDRGAAGWTSARTTHQNGAAVHSRDPGSLNSGNLSSTPPAAASHQHTCRFHSHIRTHTRVRPRPNAPPVDQVVCV